MERRYEMEAGPDKAAPRELPVGDGRERLLPLMNVFALAGGALDHIIDVIGRAAIAAVLDISAAEVAGERRPGKKRDPAAAAYHGRAAGPRVLVAPGRADRKAEAARSRGRSRDSRLRCA